MNTIYTFISELPIVVTFSIALFFVVLYGLIARKFQDKKSWKIIAIIILVVWFFVILWITVSSREYYVRSINLIPFSRLQNSDRIPRLIRDFISNMMLFIPLGMTAPFALKNYVKRPVLETLVFGFIISLIAETTQYVFAMGYSEIEDLIMNTAGTAVGTISYLIANYERKNDKV